VSQDDDENNAANPFGPQGGNAPNPFGGGGEPAANPFGGGGGEPAANPFGGGAAAPPMGGGAPPAEEPAPSAGGDAFGDIMGDSMAANPDDAAADPMAAIGMDSSDVPAPRAPAPEQPEWDQAMPGTNPGGEGAGPAKGRPARPAAAESSQTTKYMAIAAAVLVLGLGGMFAKRSMDTTAKEEAKAAAKAGVVSEADQLAALGIKPENAPPCWTRDKGYKFSYVSSSGTNVIVDSIADVPTLYRGGTKCIAAD